MASAAGRTNADGVRNGLRVTMVSWPPCSSAFWVGCDGEWWEEGLVELPSVPPGHQEGLLHLDEAEVAG